MPAMKINESKRTRRWRKTAIGALLALVAACVTINVYFPAAEAQRAADRIIDQVWGQRPSGQKRDQGRAKPGADRRSDGAALPGRASTAHVLLVVRTAGREAAPESGPGRGPAGTSPGSRLLEWLFPSAEAAQANIDISSPTIRKLTASMAARYGRLAPYWNAGVIGLTEDGYVAERDLGSVALRDRRTVKALVAAENRDRRALYAEIARANRHPEWEDQIRATFAERWVSRARSGWWYRSGGRWRRK